MTEQELREKIIQGVNIILLENLVRPHPITNYREPKDINAYREWLEHEVDTKILALIKEAWTKKEKEYLEAIEGARECGYLSGKNEGKEALPELARKAGYLAPDEDIIRWAEANGYVKPAKKLNRGASGDWGSSIGD